jgi:hypothetical protein
MALSAIPVTAVRMLRTVCGRRMPTSHWRWSEIPSDPGWQVQCVIARVAALSGSKTTAISKYRDMNLDGEL